ncbi:MAG: hypothetical protein AAF411_01115 [Myxococcota bacterium]
MNDIERFLELVRRELGATDARLEFGARALPAVHVVLESGFAVSAVFEDGPPEGSVEQLEQLVQAFAVTLDEIETPAFRSHGPRTALDEALGVLAGHAHADAAWVFDDRSPALWGSSLEPRGPEDIDAAVAFRELERSLEPEDLAPILSRGEGDVPPGQRVRLETLLQGAPERSEADWNRRLQIFRCASDVRHAMAVGSGRTRHVSHAPDAPYLARSFGGSYRLLLVFADPGFSELHAEAAMIHALPWIEKLTGALPPIDPGGGKVVKMRRLRPV